MSLDGFFYRHKESPIALGQHRDDGEEVNHAN